MHMYPVDPDSSQSKTALPYTAFAASGAPEQRERERIYYWSHETHNVRAGEQDIDRKR
jgi:hypothetical protein